MMTSITVRAASVVVATSIGTAALMGTSTAEDADNRVAGYHESKIECMEAGALGQLEKEWSVYQCVKVENDRWALNVGQAQPTADRENGYHETGRQGEGNGGRLLAGALPYTGGLNPFPADVSPDRRPRNDFERCQMSMTIGCGSDTRATKHQDRRQE